MRLKITISDDADGSDPAYEHSVEMVQETISLTEETYEWLKQAFLGLGFAPKTVREFFSTDSGDGK